MKFVSNAFLFLLTCAGYNPGFSIEVQGHRGSRGSLPENTLPAFAAAIEAGVDALELDLHLSQDGHVIIYHDYMIHSSSIHLLTLADIKTVDCGSKANPNFPKQQPIPGERIPTLDELFHLITHSKHPNAKKVRLNLEIKRDKKKPDLSANLDDLVKAIVCKVKEYGFKDKVYYSSFDIEVLKKLREVDLDAKIGFLFGEQYLSIAKQMQPENPFGFLIDIAKSVNASIISPNYQFLTNANILKQFHQSGLKVITWTVNHPDDWRKLIDMGVDGIITDYPKELISFLK